MKSKAEKLNCSDHIFIKLVKWVSSKSLGLLEFYSATRATIIRVQLIPTLLGIITKGLFTSGENKNRENMVELSQIRQTLQYNACKKWD